MTDADSDAPEGHEKPPEDSEAGGAVERQLQGLDDDFITFGSDSDDGTDDAGGAAAPDAVQKPPAVCAAPPSTLYLAPCTRPAPRIPPTRSFVERFHLNIDAVRCWL